ncbi:hypothetical protein CHISP_0195 [Chitinispirillum alkaliphilum]|nr:hypothetical protein CHISP_0195 [Chitinispirillum alkaliphilum]
MYLYQIKNATIKGIGMFIKNYCIIGIAAIASLAALVYGEDAMPEIRFHGNIQIQARKELYDNGSTNNLDQFWGRANFGGTVSGENVSGRINIQAFPGGFGHEVLTGATFDTSGQGAITEQKAGIPNIQIENAWIQHTWRGVRAKVGRFSQTTSKTLYFGNYLNQNPGGMFMSRIAYFNAVEFSTKTGPLSSSIILSAGDKTLNKGSLRIYERLSLAEGVHFGVGYFGNVFDRVHNNNAEITNRFILNGEYTVIRGFVPYFEIGIIENHAEESWDIPLNIGFQIPGGNFVDFVALEMEYSPETTRKNNPLGVNLAVMKRVNDHSVFQAGISTCTSADSFGNVVFGLRYTGILY